MNILLIMLNTVRKERRNHTLIISHKRYIFETIEIVNKFSTTANFFNSRDLVNRVLYSGTNVVNSKRH
jgi:hypothetical protein